MSGTLPLLCILATTAVAAYAQQEPAVFQVTAEMVVVDVQVLHVGTRSPLATLRREDVQIFEDGVPQKILQFSRDELPLSVVLLFDLTDSVRGVLKQLAQGSRAALEHFKPADEAAVMVYSGSARLIDGFTLDRERTLRAITAAAGMKSHQPAHFNEALYQAALQLGQSGHASNRRVVIWLTDNLPNVPFRKKYPVHTEAEALHALHVGDVVVAPILMKDLATLPMIEIIEAFEAPWRKSHPPGDANKYAEATGGEAMGLRGRNAGERLGDLIDELRARYTIGYRPSEVKAAGTFCRLRVALAPETSLRPQDWSVLARQGYYRK
jgi:VWFA-related protein